MTEIRADLQAPLGAGAGSRYRVIPRVRVELEPWCGGERPLGRALSQKAVVGISATSGSGGRSPSPKRNRHERPDRTSAFRKGTRPQAVGADECKGDISITPVGASWHEPRDCFRG